MGSIFHIRKSNNCFCFCMDVESYLLDRFCLVGLVWGVGVIDFQNVLNYSGGEGVYILNSHI